MDEAGNNAKNGTSSPVLTPSAVGADVHTTHSRFNSTLLMTIATFTLVVAFITTVLLIVPKQLRGTYHIEKETAAYCGDETVPVISLLNATGDPCDDLYGYVCSTAEGTNSSYLPPAFRIALAWELVRDASSSTRRAGGATERASLLRHEFRNWLRLNEGERIADFVRALLKATNVTTSNPTAPQIGRLLTKMSVRYALAPFVSFKGSATKLKLGGNPRCLGLGHQDDIITLAVRAFNDDLNANVGADDIMKVDRALDALGERAGGGRNVTRAIDKVQFRGLGDSDWRTTPNDLIFPMQPTKTDSQRLDEFVQSIENAANGTVALAYVVVCAAVKAVEGLQPETPAMRPRLHSSTCEFFGVCELDEIVKVESMRSTAADKRIRNIFSEVQEAVSSAALNLSSLFGTSNVTALVEQLNRVTLLLPSDIAGLDATLPDMSNSFVADLLALRSHSFEIRRMKRAREIPNTEDLFMPEVVRRASVIYIPANLYLFLNPGSERDWIFDLADLAVGLAAELWSFLLDRAWGPEESGPNPSPVAVCFKATLFKDASDKGTWRNALHSALGLMSVAIMKSHSDWLEGCISNSTHLSKAHAFLLYWVYNRCAIFPSAVSRRVINIALRSFPFTAETFSCAPTTPMAQRPACLENLSV